MVITNRNALYALLLLSRFRPVLNLVGIVVRKKLVQLTVPIWDNGRPVSQDERKKKREALLREVRSVKTTMLERIELLEKEIMDEWCQHRTASRVTSWY
jgi:hypothetical protein